MALRDTDQRGPEEGIPDADVGVSRAAWAETDVTRGTLLTGSATSDGQPPELCEHLGRRVAWGNGRGQSPVSAWVPTSQDELPEDLQWGLEYRSDLRLLTKKRSDPASRPPRKGRFLITRFRFPDRPAPGCPSGL